MESLFAPWRMEFVEKHKPSDGCPLCNIAKCEKEEDLQIVGRGKNALVVMNKFPYSNGHLMVMPNRHEANFINLTKDELYEMTELTSKAVKALQNSLKPEGINIGMNLGKAAGAGIDAHLHQHLVPRWLGDTNFMPLLGEVKIISEHLETTYKRIRKAWKAL